MSQNTVISIEQKITTIHRIVVKGTVPEHVLCMIAEKIDDMYNVHPDDKYDPLNDAGLEIIDKDADGCFEGCEYSYLDDCVIEEGARQ